jgi:hypothetical protein
MSYGQLSAGEKLTIDEANTPNRTNLIPGGANLIGGILFLWVQG